jgi:prepilin-type N-terminal cleavage/methylation domain-containing protein
MKIKIKKGFTLVEVILSVVITAIAFPFIMKGLLTSHVKQIDTQRVSDFCYLFQEKMEQMINAGYDGAPSLTLPAVNPENPISDFPDYRRDTEVSYLTDTYTGTGSATAYRKAIVKVTHIKSGYYFSASSVLRRRT